MGNPIASLGDVTPPIATTVVSAGAGKSSTPAPEPVAQTATPSAAAAAASTAGDMRLVIEDDKAAGCYVYKVIDRKTGEVVQQTPSEQMVKLRESDGYLAGDVIKAQV